MKVIGIEKSSFTSKETGALIEGSNVDITYSIDQTKGKGVAAERIYITDAKASAMDVDLSTLVGKEVVVVYNRYGRVQSIIPAA